MSSFPTWVAWAIIAACPLLGPAIAFVVVLAVAALDRWITGARETTGLVPVEAGVIGQHVRRGKISLRPKIRPQSAREPLHDEPVGFAIPPI